MVSDQDTQMRAHISSSLGISYADLGDYDKANEYLESSFKSLLALGHPAAILSSGSAYSNVLVHKEEFLHAKQIIFQALKAQNEVAFYDGLIGLHYNLGRVYMALDMKDSAEFAFTKALDFKDSSRSQYLDESMARLKIEYDLDKNELERNWLQEQNELKDGVIQSSKIIVALSIITLVLFGGLLIVINQNRSSLKKQQLELQLKNEALRESNQNNQRILSLIAHDVRGPLASLEALIKFHQKEDNYSAFETLTIAKGSISTLNSLVSSLLNWARKEKGLSQFEPSLIPLQVELSKIKDLYTHQLTFKQIAFDVSIPQHVMIYADENMLHTALRNIVTNAIKFTPTNGRITISHRINADYDEICITDNGIGISEENLHLMREGQISSQKGTYSELGTGLGVLLVRDMMTAHSGKLTIHSKKGEGSTFCLQFPKSVDAYNNSETKVKSTAKI
jgi:signal transduction histidine kinase